MPPRFDDDGRELRLSVADLLDRDLGRTLGFANRGGYERLWVGQAIHSTYQEAALREDPTYRREVVLELRFVHRGWQVELHGRADGVRRDGEGRLWIEEIKSVRSAAPLKPAQAEMYRQQAMLYAWMLSQQESEPASAELVLIPIGGGSVDRLELPVDAAALEAGVKRRLNRLLLEHEKRRQEVQRRQQAAERLSFPFHRLRPGQEEIVEAVHQALEQGEHLLVEAATGLGKTVATLFPVLRYSLAHEKRVYILTAKTLQQEMATTVLELLNRDGDFHSLRLRAKSRMCANGEILCHEEYCPYAKDYALKLQRSQLLKALLEQHSHVEPDDVFGAAKAETVCPFEVSLELTGRVQVVVCDYNYVFDPYVRLESFASHQELSQTILVIDEAHNLLDRGRGYYSPRLEAGEVRLTASRLAQVAAAESFEGAALVSRLEELSLRLARIIEDTVNDALGEECEAGAAEVSLPEEELLALRPHFDRAFIDYLEHRRENQSFRSEDPFVELYFALLRFLNTLELATGPHFSQFVEAAEGRRSIGLLCKDASLYLGRILNRTHGAIGLSATLSPAELYRDLLGFDPERTADLSISNPFPKEHRRVVVDASVTTTWRQRSSNYEPIARGLGELASSVPGNCLALFPSYRFLTEVADRLEAGGTKRVLVQRRADSEEGRQEILHALRSALFGDILLLAVAGGVFAEGVDYPGEMLKAVAVVGPCLPAVTLEQKLLEGYYEERFARGFEYAFVVPGMTRVVQAAGRLIRTPKDTGVIALFDRRFLQSPYSHHLPGDWLPSEGVSALSAHPASVAAAFFEEQP